MRFSAIPALLGLVLSASGCSMAEERYEPTFVEATQAAPVYSLAVHPLHNPSLLKKTYGPLIEYLETNVKGVRFKLVASRDYATFDRRIAAAEFDFALANPYQAVVSTQTGYRVFAKVGSDQNFRGIIVVRRDSPVETLAGLRGKRISYPAPTAVAATMLPQYYLHSNAVPLQATRTLYVGSMESALESVRTGGSDAAAIWPDPWQKYARAHPAAARQLEVRWVTPHLVNNALVVRRSVPSGVTSKVLTALRALGTTERGKPLLDRMSISSFEPAENRAYEAVRQFLVEFSAEVRPLPPIRSEPL